MINVFVDPETGEQPLDDSVYMICDRLLTISRTLNTFPQVSEFVLNEGAFQIPLVRSGLPANRPLSVK